jgi:hypothetical protein
MTALPNNWVDEDRSEIVEQIVEGMISEYTLEQLRQYVWDSLYDQLIFQEWPELWAQAEKYAPDLTEKFNTHPNASF